jgi:formate-dependent nitrite reductase cytochrome c552 subunit
MCNVFDGGAARAARREAEMQRAAEEQRQARVRESIGAIDRTFAQFDDSFFNNRERAYVDFAMPQASDQYDKARRDLIAALANSGLTRSSVGAQQLADLDRDYAMRRADIQDAGRSFAQEQRASVQQARSGLVSQANSIGDAAAAANSATAEASRLTAAPTFSPLGALFQNVGAGIGAVRRIRETDDVRGQLSSGARLFNLPTNAGRVVN